MSKKGFTDDEVERMANDYPISREMVELWVGSDTQRNGIIEILWELANGEYEVGQMIQDIIDTND